MSTGSIQEIVASVLAHANNRPPPESTYRLQFHKQFTFRDAIAILPYLRQLGVTHVYASPYLKAKAGSTHGYDIVDHRALNPEIGSTEDHEAFIAAIRQSDLRLILDVVPNHMGIATNDNLWWNDVLENGPSSPYAAYFDIAWNDTSRPELQQKVLLPVLGEPYGLALEDGKLRLEFESGTFFVWYYDRRFPVAPRSFRTILRHRMEVLGQRLGTKSPDFAEYQSILTAIGHLPDRTETEHAQVVERHREKEIIKRRLSELSGRNDVVKVFLDENVLQFNGATSVPRSFDLLDELLSHQCYRMSFWRVALEEINYRRFFDVNELAAICVEREEVFNAVHELIFQWIAEGKVDGLRVDHPDGLYNPREYFLRLQRESLVAQAQKAFEKGEQKSSSEWADIADDVRRQVESSLAGGDHPTRWPLHVVAEKILGANEPVPSDWAIHGTCGYEFIRAVTGLFIDETSEAEFTRLYREINPSFKRFLDVLYRSKRLILTASLAAELNMLTYQLDRLAQKNRRSRDFTLNGLRDAIKLVISCFPVYRSYILEEDISPRDREMIETALSRAGARTSLMSPAVLRFVGDMLLLEYPEGATEADKAEQRRFTGKFQQLTSPVMAKGLEDTVFYMYNRLISLNEVGGSPEWPKQGVSALHEFNADRQAKYPYSMSTLSTHDTKRSEDVRARIHVLSELPKEWSDASRRWFNLNAAHRKELDGHPVPDANEEYLIYQTLIGVWPPGEGEPGTEFADRIKTYMLKALHEAKIHSSWLNPNAKYDEAVQGFVAGILDQNHGRSFLDDFRPFQKKVARYGAINSLAQTLLKFTSPGVADTYQGAELPDFSLVDPDNRRPVNYGLRQSMLNQLMRRVDASDNDLAAFLQELLEHVEDGRAKLYVTWRALNLRRQYPGLFSEGEYRPLSVTGQKANHIFAFARHHKGVAAVVAVPRLLARMNPDETMLNADQWSDTGVSLSGLKSDDMWTNVLSHSLLGAKNGVFAAHELFHPFPVALLIQE